MGIRDFQIEVIRPDQTYSLNDYSDWFVTAAGGLSIPANSRFIERGALQHGATNRGFKLDPRYFDIVLETVDISEQTYWENRETVSRIFAPTDDLISLKFTLGTLERQIDCSARGVVTGGSAQRAGYKQKWGVQFVAPDPLFYDPARNTTLMGGWGSSGFTVPITVPFDFGASAIDDVVIIDNVGSWKTFPEIQIIGPIVDPVLTNITTGYKLDFTGVTLGSGNERIIDTSFATKTVVDENGTNKIADLTSDSDLTAFSLEVGTNSLTLSGTGISSATQIIIRYYTKYIAI